MRTRICIVGDSHCGALRRAWDKSCMADARARFELTFFCQRAKGLAALSVQDAKLIPTEESLADAIRFTSGGRNCVAPEEYDVFLIYGAGAAIPFLDPSSCYSRAALTATFNDLAKATLSFTLLTRLRELTDKPVFIGHPPLPAGTARPPEDTDGSSYLHGIRSINALLYAPLRAKLLAQPPATIAGTRFTRLEFSKGSRRLAIGDHSDDELHGEDDDVHMNDEFGALWLTDFLRTELPRHEGELP